MHREERESAEICAACDGSVSVGTERGFSFGLRNALCWSCAVQRGGRYDAERDTCTQLPDLTDLPYDAYGDAALSGNVDHRRGVAVSDLVIALLMV